MQKHVPPCFWPCQEIQKMISDVDDDGSGTIGYEEFLKMMTHKILNRDPKDEILKAFRLFDDDETGKISFKNLKRVAKELGERMTDEELQEMIDEADRDGDGEVNEEEFLRIMKKTNLFWALQEPWDILRSSLVTLVGQAHVVGCDLATPRRLLLDLRVWSSTCILRIYALSHKRQKLWKHFGLLWSWKTSHDWWPRIALQSKRHSLLLGRLGNSQSQG